MLASELLGGGAAVRPAVWLREICVCFEEWRGERPAKGGERSQWSVSEVGRVGQCSL